MPGDNKVLSIRHLRKALNVNCNAKNPTIATTDLKMLQPIDLHINRFAQDRINLEELLSWFRTLSNEEKREAIMTTGTFLEQAHPDLETIEQGIKAIPMKPTVTPIVLLKTHSLKIATSKILLLPERELDKSFLSLVSLFKIADIKRRDKWCKDSCTHEWHNLDANIMDERNK